MALHVLTWKELAVKIINNIQQKSPSLQKLSHKIPVMKVLNHLHLGKFFKVIDTEETLHLLVKNSCFHYFVAYGGRKRKRPEGEKYHSPMVNVYSLEDILLQSGQRCPPSDGRSSRCCGSGYEQHIQLPFSMFAQQETYFRGIMKDPWMNMSHEEKLEPCPEPSLTARNPNRLGDGLHRKRPRTC
ncbi:hypothetical protein GH733_005581 [Mirounga leonina]|nr:hypothetical protein GH733_005581 [Mirounga leonina]